MSFSVPSVSSILSYSFVPFSPVPVTGYTVMVSKEEVVDLPITVDEAFQYMLSAGVIMPQAERPQSLQEMIEPPYSAT